MGFEAGNDLSKLDQLLGFRAGTLISAIGLVVSARAPEAAHAKPLVFTQVTVIDATGTPAKTDFTVIVRDSRIAELGPSAQVRIPDSAQIVEARGKFLIPGAGRGMGQPAVRTM